MASTCYCVRGHRGCGSCDRCRYLGKGPSGWAPGEFAAAAICWTVGILVVAAFFVAWILL